MTTDRLTTIALENLRASANDSWSYLCGSDVQSFGFFLWEWCEDCNIERADEDSAREFAESGEHGVAWLAPVAIDNNAKAIALFTGHVGNVPEDEPFLEGVFSNAGDAKAYLRLSGVIAEDSPLSPALAGFPINLRVPA